MKLERTRLIYEDASLYAAAADGPVLICLWHAQPTPDGLYAFCDAQRAWLEGLAGGAYNLSVLGDDIGLALDDATKRAAADIRDANVALLRGNGTLVERTGFMGALARSAISAVELLGRGSMKNEVFKSVDQACEHIAAVLGKDAAFAAGLAADIAELKQAPGAQGPI